MVLSPDHVLMVWLALWTLVGSVEGVLSKVKSPILEQVPPYVVTVTLPLEPLPTTAVILVFEFRVKLDAAVPPNLTAVVPVKSL